jgi:hypothetical protein
MGAADHGDRCRHRGVRRRRYGEGVGRRYGAQGGGQQARAAIDVPAASRGCRQRRSRRLGDRGARLSCGGATSASGSRCSARARAARLNVEINIGGLRRGLREGDGRNTRLSDAAARAADEADTRSGLAAGPGLDERVGVDRQRQRIDETRGELDPPA